MYYCKSANDEMERKWRRKCPSEFFAPVFLKPKAVTGGSCLV